MRLNRRSGTKLFLGGLSWETTEGKRKAVIVGFGIIREIGLAPYSCFAFA